MQRIEFRDANDLNYIVSVPVLAQDKPTLLRMWVAYDKGKRCSYYDYSDVKRGYYLYFSFEEPSPDYPCRILSTYKNNYRLYLGEVKRKSEGWYKDFSTLAAEIVLPAIKETFSDLNFDWDKLSFRSWSGRGSGVGMYCDFYKIIFPKDSWLYIREEYAYEN